MRVRVHNPAEDTSTGAPSAASEKVPYSPPSPFRGSAPAVLVGQLRSPSPLQQPVPAPAGDGAPNPNGYSRFDGEGDLGSGSGSFFGLRSPT